MTDISFKNRLYDDRVEVTATFDDVSRTYDFPVSEVPGPKQMFYSTLDKLREEFGEEKIPVPSEVNAPDTW